MFEMRNQLDIMDRLYGVMEKNKLDAMILASPEAIFYATGFASNFLYLSNQIGLTLAVIPKAGKATLICNEFEYQAAVAACKDVNIISYPVWIYIEDYDKGDSSEKPAQPDLNQTFKTAIEVITSHYHNPIIGVQSEVISHSKWNYLIETVGRNNLKDCSQALTEARMIKTKWEIEVLRKAAELSEVAMVQTANAVVPGMTEADITQIFKMYCQKASADVVTVLQAHTFASDFAPAVIPRHNRIKSGDIIRLDGGVMYCGYGADLARTFALGNTTYKRREEIFSTLLKGYRHAKQMLGPGVPMCDVFNEVIKVIRADIPTYKRGHHGHSIGCNRFTEEAPFIAPNEKRVFEPGMIFCLEMPYYSSKNHSYNIEDTFLITDDGVEFFTSSNESLYL